LRAFSTAAASAGSGSGSGSAQLGRDHDFADELGLPSAFFWRIGFAGPLFPLRGPRYRTPEKVAFFADVQHLAARAPVVNLPASPRPNSLDGVITPAIAIAPLPTQFLHRLPAPVPHDWTLLAAKAEKGRHAHAAPQFAPVATARLKNRR